MSESNINVAVKMRPLIKREIDKKIPSCWRKSGNKLVDTVTGTNEFPFDLIFDEESTTRELYDKVARPIVSSSLAGVNGTVFAYGQTSSGKTHTMMGDEENDGLMLMAIKHIFNEVESSNIEFVLRVGFIELYNEKVYDLYDPDNVDLKMVEKNNDIYVNCKEAICKSVDDMYNVITIGNKNKKIGDTYMNDRSSRSHTIFRISIESIDAVSEKAKISNLNLVDLAGSERASQTGATGTRFVEGAHINKSLLSLSKVVNKLINNDNCHINYRDSKLTRYLQSSLGGNAMAAIICTLCPTALEETISTLYFAQRAMKVTNKPRVNEIISDATMIKQLHNQITMLKVELEKAKSEANSTVPGIMKELMLHQGQILNYRKAETKAKLRRRTWTTFDNELAVISESSALVLNAQQSSMSDLRSDAVAPMIHMINSDRGIGEFEYDPTKDFEKMSDEFDYKSKYQRLLHDYEELQEFTNWENKLGIEPDAESEYKAQIAALEEEVVTLKGALQCAETQTDASQYTDHIASLEKEQSQLRNSLQLAQQEKDSVEYLYEQHQKKAEQREKDLLSMMEEMKSGELTRANVEEKNFIIQELQEQVRTLSSFNDELQRKVTEHGDVEQRVLQLQKVELELEELRNTITVLTNTILTLENEKKEMSIRFNESMSVSTIEMTQSVVNLPNPELAASVAGDLSKLQTENDELSSKVMELIEENDELKQRVQEVSEQLSAKEREEVAMLEKQMLLMEEKSQDYDKHIRMLQESLDGLHHDLNKAEAQLKDSQEDFTALQERMKSSELHSHEMQEQLSAAGVKVDSLERQLEGRTKELQVASDRAKELEDELKACEVKMLELDGQFVERENKLLEELQEASDRSKELENELKACQGQMLELETQFVEREAKLLEESQIEQARLITELKKNRVSLEELQKEYEDLLKRWSQQSQVFDEERRSLEENINRLKEMLNMKEMEMFEKINGHSQDFDGEKTLLEERVAQLVREMEQLAEENKISVTEGKEERTLLEEEIRRLKEDLQQQTDEKHTKITELIDEKRQLEEEINHLYADLQLKSAENDSRSMDIAEDKKHLQMEIDNLSGELISKQQEFNEKTAALEEEKKSLEMELERLKEDLKQKAAEIELEKRSQPSTQEVEQRLNCELDVQLQKVHSLTKELSAIKAHVNELESLVQEKDEIVAKLAPVREDLEEKCQRIVELEALVESEANEVRSALEEKVNAIAEGEGKLEALKVLLGEKENTIEKLKQELQSLDSSQDREQVECMKIEMARAQEEIRSKDQQIDEFPKKMGELEQVIDQKSQEISAAKITLEELSEKNKSLEKTLAETDAQKGDMVKALQAEREKLMKEVTSLTGQQTVAEKRFEEFGRQLQSTESQKEELTMRLRAATDESARLISSLEEASQRKSKAEEQLRDLDHKHGILKSRIESLEQELSTKNVALAEAQMQLQSEHERGTEKDKHEDEVAKLQSHIKKLRTELTDLQKKEPRKARRSSAFDSNRHLIGEQKSVETQTDPVNEQCQCEALNLKVNELKKSNMLKEMHLVELREAEKRSPMLLENYTLKKRLAAAKTAEANHAKEMVKMEERLYQAVKQASHCKACENKKHQYSVACQTMPDMNLEKIAELQAQIAMQKNKYGEVKEVVLRQQQKMKRLEEQLADPEQIRGAENNPNQPNQLPYDKLRSKYDLVKSVVEKRYYMIIQLQKDLDELRNQKTCVSCKKPISSLQVP